jgi:hypothetical protein
MHQDMEDTWTRGEMDTQSHEASAASKNGIEAQLRGQVTGEHAH